MDDKLAEISHQMTYSGIFQMYNAHDASITKKL